MAARSTGAMRELFQAIVDKLEALGVPRGRTRIYLIEPPAESWGVMRGQPAFEVDLGFQIDI